MIVNTIHLWYKYTDFSKYRGMKISKYYDSYRKAFPQTNYPN